MRAYLEITNVCNRKCAFCAGTGRAPLFVPPETFRARLEKAAPFADEVFPHILGEPLLHPRFEEIARICADSNVPFNLVTNGTLLAGKYAFLLGCAALRQINFSLHALAEGTREDGNTLETVFSFCRDALESRPELYLNLRLWNLPDDFSNAAANAGILRRLHDFFPSFPAGNAVFSPGRKSRRIAGRLYLNCDTVFQWPETSRNAPRGGKGYCRGMREQFGVLADGRVVPCCLDSEGAVVLGNIDLEPLGRILSSPRAEAIRAGFEKGIAVEPFCRTCGFRRRFRKP